MTKRSAAERTRPLFLEQSPGTTKIPEQLALPIRGARGEFAGRPYCDHHGCWIEGGKCAICVVPQKDLRRP